MQIKVNFSGRARVLLVDEKNPLDESLALDVVLTTRNLKVSPEDLTDALVEAISMDIKTELNKHYDSALEEETKSREVKEWVENMINSLSPQKED